MSLTKKDSKAGDLEATDPATLVVAVYVDWSSEKEDPLRSSSSFNVWIEESVVELEAFLGEGAHCGIGGTSFGDGSRRSFDENALWKYEEVREMLGRLFWAFKTGRCRWLISSSLESGRYSRPPRSSISLRMAVSHIPSVKALSKIRSRSCTSRLFSW